MNVSRDYWVKDIGLASAGALYSKEALKDMEGLVSLRREYLHSKPLKDIHIVGSVLVSYETANFILLLKDLGADLRWCSDSLHYSLDEACAYVASNGVPIFAKRGMTLKEYYWVFNEAVKFKNSRGEMISPDYILDDGAEFTEYMLKNHPEKIQGVKGACEQTTSGITLLYTQFINKGRLPFPVIDVNNSVTKAKFDNVYGSRESLIEGIQNAMNVQLGGKRVVIFGFGEVGKGCAEVMRGVGANVSIVEVDPIMAMQAIMEGYNVLEKKKACAWGTIFITTTGCIKTIDKEEIAHMRSGAFVMNMSEHDMEVNSHFFRENTQLTKIKINDYLDKYVFPDGKEIYLLCDGFIVNLYAGKGHPPKVMGITFTNMAIALLDMVEHPKKYKDRKIYRLTRELDEKAALLSFPELKQSLSKLTKDQCEYLGVGANGPFKRDDYRY